MSTNWWRVTLVPSAVRAFTTVAAPSSVLVRLERIVHTLSASTHSGLTTNSKSRGTISRSRRLLASSLSADAFSSTRWASRDTTGCWVSVVRSRSCLRTLLCFLSSSMLSTEPVRPNTQSRAVDLTSRRVPGVRNWHSSFSSSSSSSSPALAITVSRMRIGCETESPTRPSHAYHPMRAYIIAVHGHPVRWVREWRCVCEGVDRIHWSCSKEMDLFLESVCYCMVQWLLVS